MQHIVFVGDGHVVYLVARLHRVAVRSGDGHKVIRPFELLRRGRVVGQFAHVRLYEAYGSRPRHQDERAAVAERAAQSAFRNYHYAVAVHAPRAAERSAVFGAAQGAVLCEGQREHLLGERDRLTALHVLVADPVAHPACFEIVQHIYARDPGVIFARIVVTHILDIVVGGVERSVVLTLAAYRKRLHFILRHGAYVVVGKGDGCVIVAAQYAAVYLCGKIDLHSDAVNFTHLRHVEGYILAVLFVPVILIRRFALSRDLFRNGQRRIGNGGAAYRIQITVLAEGIPRALLERRPQN